MSFTIKASIYSFSPIWPVELTLAASLTQLQLDLASDAQPASLDAEGHSIVFREQ